MSNLDHDCVKECVAAYSSCMATEDNGEEKTEKLQACKEAYDLCISTCPPE